MHHLHVPSAGAQLDQGYPLARRAVQRGLQHAKNRHQLRHHGRVFESGGGRPACLSLLLLQAGDVERNPGPPPGTRAAWARALSYAASASSDTTAGAWDSVRTT